LFFVPLFYYLIITMKEKMAGGRVAGTGAAKAVTESDQENG